MQRKPSTPKNGQPPVVAPTTPEKPESNNDEKDDVFEEDHDDRYQQLGDDGSQDIYLDLGEPGVLKEE